MARGTRGHMACGAAGQGAAATGVLHKRRAGASTKRAWLTRWRLPGSRRGRGSRRLSLAAAACPCAHRGGILLHREEVDLRHLPQPHRAQQLGVSELAAHHRQPVLPFVKVLLRLPSLLLLLLLLLLLRRRCRRLRRRLLPRRRRAAAALAAAACRRNCCRYLRMWRARWMLWRMH